MKWIEKISAFIMAHIDKVMHFFVCGFIALYASLYDLGLGIFLPIFLGVAKEIIDAIGREREMAREGMSAEDKAKARFIDWGDLAADLLGTLATIVPLYFLTRG